MRNFQADFETVAKHLFAQDKRSMNNNVCLYRGPGGTKCAIGVLISDADYNPEYDTGGQTGILHLASHYEGLKDFNDNFYYRLQRIHDYGFNWLATEWMRKEFKELAQEYKLDSSIVDTLSFKDR